MFWIADSTPDSMKRRGGPLADLGLDALEHPLLVGRAVEVTAQQGLADPGERQREVAVEVLPAGFEAWA